MILLKTLEQTSLPRILVYLLEKGRASRTELKRDITASQQAIYRAIPLLQRNGLIKEIQSDGFPYKIEIELTQKGRLVAEHLVEIERLLSINDKTT